MDSLKENIEQLGALLNRLTVQVAGLDQRLKQVERAIEATNIIAGAPSASPNFIVMPHSNVPPTMPDPNIETPIEDFDLRGISSALFFHRMCQKLDNTYEDDNAFAEAQRCIQAAKHFHHAWSLFKEEDE
jgi:hypothetical protein